MRSGVVLGMIVAAAAWSGVAGAQAATVDSTPYVQARDMVSNGEVEQGHRLVDSLLKAATPGSPAYAEGLYWRAAISQNARDAERDYRQVVVDYPLSPRVPDALLRLGQLEAARGDRDAALQHFQRIVLEYPDSPRRAEASYWVANTYLSHNDLQRGCTANADALARVASTNVELKNRIDYQQLRCRNVQLAKGAAPAVPAPAPVAPAPTAPAVASAPAKTTSSTREVPVTESRSAVDTPVVAAKPESTATAATTSTTSTAITPAPTVVHTDDSTSSAPSESVATRTTTRTTSAAHTTSAVHTKIVKTSKGANAVKATSAAESKTITSTPKSAAATAAPSSGRGFAVQVAAYKSRVQADSLAAKLRARGYASHVDGDATPYRVRIGHYHTRADAVAALKRLQAKKIDGFVTEP